MQKYSKQLILAYINGLEVDNIDLLESDYKFMLQVIETSKDKNMYNLCSEEIKKNYEFIKHMIEIFKDDKDFINQISEEYISKFDSDNINVKELFIIMADLLENSKYFDNYTFYNLKRSLMYFQEMMIITSEINDIIDPILKQEKGMGFVLITLDDELGKSDIILKYFAKKFMEEIFYEDGILTLNEIIHSQFSKFEKLEKIGIKNFILNYVGVKDTNLASYLYSHIELISDLVNDIKNISINWEKYEADKKEMQYLIFEQETRLLIEKYNFPYTFLDVCCHIDRMNLGLSVKLCDFEYCGEDKQICHITSEDLEDIIDKKNLGFMEYKCLKEIIELVESIYRKPFIQVLPEIIEEKNDGARILKFESKKRK